MKLLPSSRTLRSREIVSRYRWDLLQMVPLLKGKEMKSMISKFKLQIHPLRFRNLNRTKSNFLKSPTGKKMNRSLRKDLSQLNLLHQNKMKRSNHLSQRRDFERMMTNRLKNLILNCLLKRKLLKRKGRNSLKMHKKWLAAMIS